MRIGIDVDGVLINLEYYQLVEGEKFFKFKPKNPTGYKVWQIFDVSVEEDHRFWREKIFEYTKYDKALPNAKQVIDKFKADGHEIYLITARSFTTEDTPRGEKMRTALVEWLKENGIYYDKIFYSKEDKTKIICDQKIDLMIEDSPVNIEQISPLVPVVCMKWCYNQNVCGDNIINCDDWSQVYYKVNAFFGKKC